MRRFIMLPLVGCAGLFRRGGPDRAGQRRSAADADAADPADGHSAAAPAAAATPAAATSSATAAASAAAASAAASAAGSTTTSSTCGCLRRRRFPAAPPRPGSPRRLGPRRPRRAAGPTTGTAPLDREARRSALARNVRVTRTRFSTHGPAARRGTLISFRLSRPGKVLLVVRSGAGACEVVGRRQVAGTRGLNRVRFRGRIHGRPLAPGRYVIDVVVVRGKSSKRVGRVTVEIVRPGTRLTKAQRVAPVGAACAVPAGSASLPGAVVDPRSGHGRSGGAARRASLEGRRHLSRRRALGGLPSAKASGPGWGRRGRGGGLAWFGLGVYLVLFAAFLTMLVYVGRFLRGSWNP